MRLQGAIDGVGLWEWPTCRTLACWLTRDVAGGGGAWSFVPVLKA